MGGGLFPGTIGASSCLWVSTDPTNETSNFFVPEGSGTITAVSVLASATEQVQVVVLRGKTTDVDAHADTTSFACCQVEAVSPVFTVTPPPPKTPGMATPKQVCLPVEADAPPSPLLSGDSWGEDILALNILTPNAPLPIFYTGNETNAPITDLTYYPGLSKVSTKYNGHSEAPIGYQLDMEYQYLGTGGPEQFGLCAGNTQSINQQNMNPGSNVALSSSLQGTVGRALILGSAGNPPTAHTRQTVSILEGIGKRQRRVIVAQGSTTLPKGKRATITAALTPTGRVLLSKRRSLKVTVSVTATGPTGPSQTLTKVVTIRGRGH